MNGLSSAVEYEQRGFIRGRSVLIKSTGDRAVIVSNPKLTLDTNVYVWVAMEFDTYVRYMANINDLEFI